MKSTLRIYKRICELRGKDVRCWPLAVSEFKADTNITNIKCADCGSDARYIVLEDRLDDQYFKTWLYCGKCEVG